MNPKHIPHISDPNRIAHAPYNFVELPDKVVAAQELPPGDRYHLDHNTGKIECILTTQSPLYIRCGMTPKDFEDYSEFKEPCPESPKQPTEQQKKKWEEEKKKWEDKKKIWQHEKKEVLAPFFHTLAKSENEEFFPVLPGSSLRGMLRTLIEIVSFSKIDRVSGKDRLFFRAVGSNSKKESWGKEYKKYVEQDVEPKKIKAGYLKKESDSWYIQPAVEKKGTNFAWIRENSLTLSDFKRFNDDLYQIQYIPVSYESVGIDNTDRAKRLFANNVDLPDRYFHQGVLVTSGNMKQGNESSPRRNHCIVFPENRNVDRLLIDKKAIEHYLNALTDFQKTSPFDKDLGILEEDRPVFYFHDGKSTTVGFFGQSPNFRIPYSPEGNGHATTIIDFIPTNLNNPYAINWNIAPISFSITLLNTNLLVGILFLAIPLIDLADAIFGWVKQESKEKKLPKIFDKQRAGRIFFTDAIYHSNQKGIWCEDQPLTPQILSEPKPTCYPHYLVQQSVDQLELKHYASEPITETVIRGHKLYWHKGSNPNFKHPNPEDPKMQSQITKIKPINKGVTFKFDIYFENLSDVELGSLLWILSIAQDDKYCLSLGMGKPLGMGAIKITRDLYLNQREKRYEKLFDNQQWHTGYSSKPDSTQQYIDTFDEYIRKEIGATESSLEEVRRIKMLLAMLSWDETPPSDQTDQTRYLEIECDPKKTKCIIQPKNGKKTANEYAHRPVLPTPLQVMDENSKKKNNDDPNSGGSGGTPKPKPSPKKPNGGSRPLLKTQKSKPSPQTNNSTSLGATFARPNRKPKQK